MNSDLLDVGAQCSHENCRQVDFLPIGCSCTLYFCKDHILPDAHACTLPAVTTPQTSKSEIKFQRCSLEHCNKATLDAFSASEAKGAAACPQCKLAFCAEHRFPDVHTCSPQQSTASNEEASTNYAAAKALLAKNFTPKSGSTATRNPSKIPTDPVKLVQYKKVELMKMRHHAFPADPRDKPTSVAVNDRFHVKLRVGDDEKVYWLRQNVVTGKALDLLASQSKVKTSPLRLVHASEQRQLDNSQPLSAQVEDGAILILRSPLN